MSRILLSLCIPTNGISELVFPVLDSIYSQKDVSEDHYEVVIMDNGTNDSFKKDMKELVKKHSNLVYKETSLTGFLNEPEAYKNASGELIKFINHRTKLLPGALKYFVSFVENNIETKPVVYFSNGMIEDVQGVKECHNFDTFVRDLSYWSSWSTGMAIWRDDFYRLENNTIYNELYPHTTILFNERNKNRYLIDNNVLLDEAKVGHAKKGRYDLFRAFSIEYMCIITDLYRDDSIRLDTLLKVKKDTLSFIANLFFSFIIRKMPCSYDISNTRALDLYYSKREIYGYIAKWIMLFPVRKTKRVFKNLTQKRKGK